MMCIHDTACLALITGGASRMQGDPLMLPAAVAAAIGREPTSCDPLGGADGIPEDRNMLLVLDRCQHLIGAVATFAATLLARAPGIQILAISR